MKKNLVPADVTTNSNDIYILIYIYVYARKARCNPNVKNP